MPGNGPPPLSWAAAAILLLGLSSMLLSSSGGRGSSWRTGPSGESKLGVAVCSTRQHVLRRVMRHLDHQSVQEYHSGRRSMRRRSYSMHTTYRRSSLNGKLQVNAERPPASVGGRIDVSGLMLPPDTKEESIKQAALAVDNYLKNAQFGMRSTKKGKKKGRSGAMKELMELQGKTSSRASMALEMSIGAEEPASVAEMVVGISSSLPKPIGMKFQDSKVKLAVEKLLAGNSGITFGMIDEDEKNEEKASLLIVGAAGKQLPAVVKAVETNSKSHIVLLNAEFTPAPPPAARDFIERFEVVYSVLPLEIQGIMGNTQGAVFRAFEGSKSFFWRSFKLDRSKEDGERWEPVGSWKVRPNAKQLEDSMYGSGANTNPINKGISGIRNLFGG